MMKFIEFEQEGFKFTRREKYNKKEKRQLGLHECYSKIIIHASGFIKKGKRLKYIKRTAEILSSSLDVSSGYFYLITSNNKHYRVKYR